MKLLSWKLLSFKLLSEKLLSKKFASGQLSPRTPLRVSLAFTLSLGNFHLARLPGTAPDTHQLPSRTLLQAQDPGALPRRASGQLPPRPPPPRTLLQAQDPGASPGRASGQLPPRPPPPRTLFQAQHPGASPEKQICHYHHGPPRAAGHSTGHPSITSTYRAPSTGPSSSTWEGKCANKTTDPRGQPGTVPDAHQLLPRTLLQAQAGRKFKNLAHVKDRRWVVGLVFPQKCLLKVNEKDRRSSFLDSILLGGFIFATDRRSFWGLLVCASRKERIVGRDRRSGGVCMACVHSFIRGYNIL